MDDRLAIVHIIRVWLRAVLQARGFSAEAWAQRAGVAPQVLVNCLTHEGHVPNMRVLARAC